MLDTVNVRLTQENASFLEVLQQRQAVVLDELINRALSNYFFAMRFDEVRARLSPPAEGQPKFTEDEIFDLVS